MTSPTSRVLALLEILQGGGTRTAAELADRLDVDERTVRRYVGHLLDLDVPVRSGRGRYGGYRLEPGYRMPPLMLTDDEAVAVLLGLLAWQAGAPGGEGATTAIAKLRRVLPVQLARRLDALQATAGAEGAAQGILGAEAGMLLTLADAARNRRPVSLDYADRAGRTTRRTVHPSGLVAHGGHWYVAGADSISDDVRTFRLDRIRAAEVLAGGFDVPAGFDPVERLLAGLADPPYRHEVSVLVRATVEHVRAHVPVTIASVTEIAPDAVTRQAAGSREGEPAGASWVRIRMRAERLEWIPALLASLDRPFVIEHPDALRDGVRDLARRLIEHADALEQRDD